jgi:opacity protein-like surface antigen
VGYQFSNGWRVQLDALNLLNSTSYNASYAYGALLTTDSLFAMCFPTPKIPVAVCQNGFMDYSVHPLEPMAFRLTLAGPLDSVDVYGMAAEFERAIPAFPRPSANYDWTGPYIGAFGEVSWSRTNGSAVNLVTGATASPVNGNLSNWHGGIQLGFDYMTPSRLLFGVAADVTSGGTKTTTISDASGTSANQTTVFDSETLRGRFGYALDNVLFYGTAGWAWSSNQYVRTQLTGTLNNATAGADEAVNKYLSGWTAGAGVSIALAQNWNMFAEYRYTSFETLVFTLPLSQLSTSSTTKLSAIELGVNYKFSPTTSFALPSVLPPGGRSNFPLTPLYKSLPGHRPYNWTGLYFGADGG